MAGSEEDGEGARENGAEKVAAMSPLVVAVPFLWSGGL
jgi:hypothetical protein